MNYTVEFNPQAMKDLSKLPQNIAQSVMLGIEKMKDGLGINVKKLTSHTPEYRLRIGDYRILFDLENETKIIISNILHRKNAYKK